MDDNTLSHPLTGREWGLSLFWAILALVVGGWVLEKFLVSDTAAEGRWPLYDTRNDDQAYVASRINSEDGRKATFVILGNSSVREAFWPDVRMTQTLSAQGRFLNLASGYQSVIEAFFLAEAMAPRPGQTFVVFLNASSLRQENPLARLEVGAFLRSPKSLNRIGGLSGAWSTPGAAEWMVFQVRRQLFRRQFQFRLKRWAQEHFYQQPMIDYEPYCCESVAPPTSVQIDAKESQIGQEMRQHFAANLRQQSAALEAIQHLMRQHGARLVLAASPRLKRAIPGISEYEAEFTHAVGEFARNQGVEWLDLNPGIAWQADDFFDLTHVRGSGRDKWSQAFAKWLAVRTSGEPAGNI